jgi:hypothetical protein
MLTITLPGTLIAVIVLLGVLLVRPEATSEMAQGIVRGVELAIGRTHAPSPVLLDEVDSAMTGTSFEYRYQLVFPYDFFPGGSADWRSLELLSARSDAGDAITPDEHGFLDAYRLATQLGISPRDFPPLYYLATVDATVALQQTIDWARAITMNAHDEIVVQLPALHVASISIQIAASEPDRLSENETTDGEVNDFVASRAMALLIKDGILVDARSALSDRIKRLFEHDGIATVRFTDPTF